MYKVLIVDDEKLMRDALRVMVNKIENFFVADCVGTGEEAVEICKREKIHIVLMDIMMPGISGIEASKEIYATDPAVAIYIISSHTNFEYAREALNAKIREYISKPVSFSMIARLLNHFNDQQGVEETQLNMLFQILKNRQYGQLNAAIPGIVEKVFQQQDFLQQGDKRDYFLTIAGKIIKRVMPVDGQAIDIEERFPINEAFKVANISWTLWLLDIMDFAFRQMAISKNEFLNVIFDHIDVRIEHDITLSTICKDCAISQSHLSRLFKKHLGVSVMEYIHLRKIKQAKMYLAYTGLPLKEIAYRVGYNEDSYFCKVFKKYEGMTPQQYKGTVYVLD